MNPAILMLLEWSASTVVVVVTPATYFYPIEGPSQQYLILESAVSVELLDWMTWEDDDPVIEEDGTIRTWEDYVGGTASGGYFIPIEGPPT